MHACNLSNGVYTRTRGGEILTYNTELNACHDKSICSFLTCSVCLLMVGSECVWGLGEGLNFQLVRGPQN